jgi:hypothetical protein
MIITKGVNIEILNKHNLGFNLAPQKYLVTQLK